MTRRKNSLPRSLPAFDAAMRLVFEPPKRSVGRPASDSSMESKPATTLDAPCPTCGQEPGLECVSILQDYTHGRTLTTPHLDRTEDAITF